MLSSLSIPSGLIYTNTDWASKIDSHRISLRTHIDSNYPNLNFLDTNNKNPASYISISHCKAIGGYFVSNNENSAAGFDIEEASRINKELILKISTDEERSLFQDQKLTSKLDCLWLIKEAGFKAFSKDIRVMTDVKILIIHFNNNILTGELVAGSRKGIFFTGPLNSNLLFASVVSDEE